MFADQSAEKRAAALDDVHRARLIMFNAWRRFVYLKTFSIDLRTLVTPRERALPARLPLRPAPVANSLVLSPSLSAACLTPLAAVGDEKRKLTRIV